MRIKTALGAAALGLAVSGTALAQGIPGFYVGGAAGVNWLKSVDAHNPDSGLTGPWSFHTGWVGEVAGGYAFGWGPRVELEGSYRRNDIRNIDADCCGFVPAHGNAKQLGIMVNAAYDIFLGMPIIPYLGVGAGAVRLKIDHIGPSTFDPLDFVNDSKWVFGVQGFAGVDYEILPGFRLGVKYNYLHLADAFHLFTSLGSCFCGPSGPVTNIDPNNHSVMLAAQYSFGPRPVAPPPPAPVAAPPPPLQRNFLVFFDFDRSDITPEADRVIVQAANNAKTAAVTRITLTGHADRSGPVPYNQRLSERRAESVKGRLVREGIPPGAIFTIGRGETQPLVPTPDGVREPQNRRVEIVL